MVFSSFTFLFLFLPALLVCYFLCPPRARRGKNGVLLVFSLLFYACCGLRFLPVMLASIVLNYVCGLLASPRSDGSRRRAVVACAVVLNLALLGWFKYAGFLADNLSRLGWETAIPAVVLPIGISFFTFQGMSYVLDVARGAAQREKNPFRVALYISLFPQLVAGPIVRYTTISNEIVCRQVGLRNFAEGGIRFLYGLAKKVLLANCLGELADAVFGMGTGSMPLCTAWLGALAYTGQIYFDFSGYSDMAIGLGRMFGFHFNENFDNPYICRSITEFWRRWHMSLSSWFRDYVYIPLGGNRCSVGRHIFNLVIVWALTGFWHGAAWNFLAWGLFYAVLLIAEKYLWGGAIAKCPAAVRHIYAMVIVIVAWVLFRADTIGAAGSLIRVMFGGSGVIADGQTMYFLREYGWVLICGVIFSLPVRTKLRAFFKRRHCSRLSAWCPVVLALVLFGLSILQLISSTFNPFIYFRF
ncbi:MAG: MBOAT family protein [Oscillospiraceae bacterium]|nr:MBOAT family protein [Oscillospiraceae bacterium]